MALPLIPTKLTELMLLQTKWKAPLDKFLGKELLQGVLVTSVALINGTTQVNHGLGRAPIGWIPVRFRNAFAQIYDKQDTNTTPKLTLTLVANAKVTVDLYIF